MNWTDGYHTDSEYVADFFKELAPNYLDFICAINKVSPPPTKKNFRYCELGSGNGVTANILAASFPEAEFHAIDFMPVHIANARHLAAEAELDNMHFHEVSFKEADQLNLEKFDYIVLHGVYSWISKENRLAVCEFIKQHLNTGGIVYNSYNSMPGWSHVLPFREAINSMGQSHNAHTVAKVHIARNYIQKLKEKNAAFIRLNPQIEQQISELEKLKEKYLAQEYLNQDWNPLYVTEIMSEMGEAKLSYIGSATLYDNYNQYQLTAEQIELVNEQPTVPMREFTKDLLVNKKFRRDIYCRGARTLTDKEQIKIIEGFSLTLICQPEDVKLKVTIDIGEVSLNAERALPVIAVLKAGVIDIKTLVKVTGFSLSDVMSVVTVLLMSNQAILVNPIKSQKSIEKINQIISERAFSDQALSFFAYQGTGLSISPEDQVLLKHSEKLSGSQLVRKMLEEMKSHNRAFIAEGKLIQEQEEAVAHTEKLVQEFEEKKKPLYQQLGLICPAIEPTD
ncbi:biotin biosynthesis protein BioC [Piscirickettsia salmonis]|uniref:class I SAM-dependent methyltransferase n=1 Tax=Piscirickettsia salmonis TaxID=1238 RepID=UPI0012B8C064|nr:class I SAM-dependent methyltransferase [Piscirickettsia salmonis]QGP49019.1 biotin biosynthesis protein BioC [Piscirickettsia salmonis]